MLSVQKNVPHARAHTHTHRMKDLMQELPGWSEAFEGRQDEVGVERGGGGWRIGVTDEDVLRKCVK